MRASEFRKGDRVVSRVAIGAVRVGAPGTVLGPFPAIADTYDVIFDDAPVPHIFQGHMLSAAETQAKARYNRGTPLA